MGRGVKKQQARSDLPLRAIFFPARDNSYNNGRAAARLHIPASAGILHGGVLRVPGGGVHGAAHTLHRRDIPCAAGPEVLRWEVQ